MLKTLNGFYCELLAVSNSAALKYHSVTKSQSGSTEIITATVNLLSSFDRRDLCLSYGRRKGFEAVDANCKIMSHYPPLGRKTSKEVGSQMLISIPASQNTRSDTLKKKVRVSQYRIFPEGANPLSMGAVTLTIVPPEARSNNGDAWVVFKFDFVYTAPTGPTLVQTSAAANTIATSISVTGSSFKRKVKGQSLNQDDDSENMLNPKQKGVSNALGSKKRIQYISDSSEQGSDSDSSNSDNGANLAQLEEKKKDLEKSVRRKKKRNIKEEIDRLQQMEKELDDQYNSNTREERKRKSGSSKSHQSAKRNRPNQD